MGKNDKVLLDNGKAAVSSMQLYWNKAKQISRKKQDEKKTFNKEKQAYHKASKPDAQSGKEEGDKEDSNYVNKETMSKILNEKERRRHGQYQDSSISEASILNAQKMMATTGVKVPGYSSTFITKNQIDKNKRDIEKRKVEAQAARERKEQREKKAQESEQNQLEQNQIKPLVNQLQNNLIRPPNVPPPLVPQKVIPHHMHNRGNESEVNDPFFKVTESENYDPISERAKQMQDAQNTAEAQRQINLQPPPPPPSNPPNQNFQYPFQAQTPFGMQQQFYPLPPQGAPPPIYQNNFQAPNQGYQVPMMPGSQLVAQPIVVQGESTVKKSTIDLSQKKQLFVPRSMIQASNGSISTVPKEKKEFEKREALGGNIKNVSQVPTPAPFIKHSEGGIVSNANNQDLLKAFMQDIETLNQSKNNNKN